MKTFSFRHGFTIKISLLLLLLLLLMGAIQAIMTLRILNMGVEESNQRVNWNLARDMALEINPVKKEGSKISDVEPAIHYMMVLNPRLEIYILNQAGHILAFFAPPGVVNTQKINIAPIENFINSDLQNQAILGQDPRNPDQKKYFSAATLEFSDSTSGYLYIILESSEYQRTRDKIQQKTLGQSLFWAFVLALVIIGILGIILFSQLTKRLITLTNYVDHYRPGQNRAMPKISGKDEISRLGKVFFEMTERINQNLEDLHQADQQRRDMLANISHDLRSPLTSIQGYLETLEIKQHSLSQSDLSKYIKIISDETGQLRALIDNLFQLALLDNKQIQANKEFFSLTDFLNDEVMNYNKWAAEKGISLTTVFPDQQVLVELDIGLFSRVIRNLLENALKFTPKNGEVKVIISEEDKNIRVSINDTGPGIEEKNLNHIFTRFYTSDPSRSRDNKGSGLGLAIAKEILQLQGIILKVNSHPGQGSEFYFNLPIMHL